jgi:ribosomal protein L3 glutamine methyltransferase
MIEREENSETLTTIRDFIRLCYSQMMQHKVYLGHGHINPADEARQLVLAALYLPWNTEDMLDAKLLASEKQRVLAFIERRVVKREPLPYIINEAWFMQLPFYVDTRVLIPRSPIAQLIENQFSPFLRPGPLERVLDLCTGSGCIGIAAAYVFDTALVDIADISADALDVAKLNIDKHEMQEQVSIIESDLFSGITEKYDLIVSNPPYVDRDDLLQMPDEYQHEPALALGSGDDGLDICKKILAQANDYLSDEGLLVVEVGNSEVHLMQQYPEVPFTWIDLAEGGNGVFAISAQDLKEHRTLFQQV